MPQRALPPLHVIILAGGQGMRARRGDAEAPKQFRQVGGSMLLMWSVRELLAVAEVGPVTVATLTVAAPEPWHPLVRHELGRDEPDCPWLLSGAGATRTESTWLAVQALAAAHTPAGRDLVAIHDAARPLATRHLLLRVAQAAARHKAAVPGVSVTDTIVRLVGGEPGQDEACYLEREALRALQTPQVFQWEPFLAAHTWCHEEGHSFTDDGGLVAARGLDPVVVMGEQGNWKITNDNDLVRLNALAGTDRRLRD
jgi:2-C-methyl-D-erythritol 4-phosphate cytidylyltransferase/2-C-methyl-D-erythritol 2,4-cyclodiphosphate synthase